MHYDKLLPQYIVMYRKTQEEFLRAFLEVTARGGRCGDIDQWPDIAIN